jgi:hypothetical protein
MVFAGPEQPFHSLSSAFILSTLLWSNSWYRQTYLLQNVSSGKRGKANYCLSVSTVHTGWQRQREVDHRRQLFPADLIKYFWSKNSLKTTGTCSPLWRHNGAAAIRTLSCGESFRTFKRLVLPFSSKAKLRLCRRKHVIMGFHLINYTKWYRSTKFKIRVHVKHKTVFPTYFIIQIINLSQIWNSQRQLSSSSSIGMFQPDPAAARKLSTNLYDIHHCCMYSE